MPRGIRGLRDSILRGWLTEAAHQIILVPAAAAPLTPLFEILLRVWWGDPHAPAAKQEGDENGEDKLDHSPRSANPELSARHAVQPDAGPPA